MDPIVLCWSVPVLGCLCSLIGAEHKLGEIGNFDKIELLVGATTPWLQTVVASTFFLDYSEFVRVTTCKFFGTIAQGNIAFSKMRKSVVFCAQYCLATAAQTSKILTAKILEPKIPKSPSVGHMLVINSMSHIQKIKFRWMFVHIKIVEITKCTTTLYNLHLICVQITLLTELNMVFENPVKIRWHIEALIAHKIHPFRDSIEILTIFMKF